jgi:hypothetical protein
MATRIHLNKKYIILLKKINKLNFFKKKIKILKKTNKKQTKNKRKKKNKKGRVAAPHPLSPLGVAAASLEGLGVARPHFLFCFVFFF